MSAEDLEKYETEMELTLYREYRDVVGIFKYVVETDRRFYLCNQVDVKARTEAGDVFFEVSMTDAWVWDMYRPARFAKNVKVLTFKDVNVEELSRLRTSTRRRTDRRIRPWSRENLRGRAGFERSPDRSGPTPSISTGLVRSGSRGAKGGGALHWILARRRRNERGAAAVEFALVMPLLLMLLFGIISTGMTFSDHLSATNAAREGARYGAATDVSAPGWATSVKDRVKQVYFNAGETVTDDQICVELVTADGTTPRPVHRRQLRHRARRCRPAWQPAAARCWSGCSGPRHPALVFPALDLHIGAESVAYYGREVAPTCTRILTAPDRTRDERGAVAIIVAIVPDRAPRHHGHGPRLRAGPHRPPDRPVRRRRGDPGRAARPQHRRRDPAPLRRGLHRGEVPQGQQSRGSRAQPRTPAGRNGLGAATAQRLHRRRPAQHGLQAHRQVDLGQVALERDARRASPSTSPSRAATTSARAARGSEDSLPATSGDNGGSTTRLRQLAVTISPEPRARARQPGHLVGPEHRDPLGRPGQVRPRGQRAGHAAAEADRMPGPQDRIQRWRLLHPRRSGAVSLQRQDPARHHPRRQRRRRLQRQQQQRVYGGLAANGIVAYAAPLASNPTAAGPDEARFHHLRRGRQRPERHRSCATAWTTSTAASALNGTAGPRPRSPGGAWSPAGWWTSGTSPASSRAIAGASAVFASGAAGPPDPWLEEVPGAARTPASRPRPRSPRSALTAADKLYIDCTGKFVGRQRPALTIFAGTIYFRGWVNPARS